MVDVIPDAMAMSNKLFHKATPQALSKQNSIVYTRYFSIEGALLLFFILQFW
jgi:hypothetical protein